MKFNCGRLTDREYYEKFPWKLDWHRWFAWHPVPVGGGGCRWLEYVERKCYRWYCEQDYRSPPRFKYKEYRAIND